MATPQGHSVAGKPYREITAAELGLNGLVIPGGAGPLSTVTLQLVPWWAGGYSRCRIVFKFNLSAGPGQVQLLVAGISTDEIITDVILSEMTQPDLGEIYSAAAQNVLELSFDDGQLPGNYKILTGLPFGVSDPSDSMPLNPSWNRAPFLLFQIQNNGGAGSDLTVDVFDILLGGR